MKFIGKWISVQSYGNQEFGDIIPFNMPNKIQISL